MSLQVAVVICTYNRSVMLGNLLQSLTAAEAVPDIDLRVVVVDNNSSDHTRQVVERFADRLPLKYLFEPRQGKAFALNSAIAAVSEADLLLFTDDDVELPPEWLVRFVEAAREHPEYGWYGGRVLPWWPDGEPAWLREDTRAALAGYFVDYDLGEVSRPYAKGDRWPIGAAMAVRQQVFAKIGLFREDLGPHGRLRGVGEETDLIERAVEAGYKGFYVADACCRHYVDPKRMRLSGFFLFGIGKGLNQYRSEANGRREGSLLEAVGQVVRGGWQLMKGRGDRFRVCLINAGIEIGRRTAAREARH
jgi:glycosyltransferase involved in cell wall biosynthesis